MALAAGDLAEHSEEVSAEEFADAGFLPTSAKHGFGEHRVIPAVAHMAGKSRASVEVGAEDDVVLARNLSRSFDDVKPLVDRVFEFFGSVDADHRECRGDELVDLREGHFGFVLLHVGTVPKRLAGLLCSVVEHRSIVELVADVEADEAALLREFFERRFSHQTRDVVAGAEAVMRRNDGGVGEGDGLFGGFSGGVGDVDDDAEAVAFLDHRATVFGEAVEAGDGAAGVGKVVGVVVGGKLEGAEAELVEHAQDAEVAVHVEAAFEVEDSGDFFLLLESLDFGDVAGDADGGGVPFDLAVGEVDQAEGLLGFEVAGVVILGDEESEEEGVEAAFFGADEVKVAVLDALADVAAVIELAGDDVNVGVEDEHLFVELPGGEGEGGEKVAAVHAVWRKGAAGAR